MRNTEILQHGPIEITAPPKTPADVHQLVYNIEKLSKDPLTRAHKRSLTQMYRNLAAAEVKGMSRVEREELKARIKRLNVTLPALVDAKNTVLQKIELDEIQEKQQVEKKDALIQSTQTIAKTSYYGIGAALGANVASTGALAATGTLGAVVGGLAGAGAGYLVMDKGADLINKVSLGLVPKSVGKVVSGGAALGATAFFAPQVLPVAALGVGVPLALNLGFKGLKRLASGINSKVNALGEKLRGKQRVYLRGAEELGEKPVRTV